MDTKEDVKNAIHHIKDAWKSDIVSHSEVQTRYNGLIICFTNLEKYDNRVVYFAIQNAQSIGVSLNYSQNRVDEQ